MKHRRGRAGALALLVFSLFLSGCKAEMKVYDIAEYAPNVQCRTDGKEGEAEEACFRFLTGSMMERGGIYTRYLESKKSGKLASGHEVLAESEGLMLRYAVQRHDRKLYEEIRQYITQVLAGEDYLSYRVKQNGERMEVNAVVDDLRIIRGLYEGGDQELALKYAAQLQKTNIKQGLLVDYYTASDQGTSDDMTLCYGDLAAMDYVAGHMEEWKELRLKTEKVMREGYLGDDFPFFQTRYHVRKKKYTSENIFMIEALLTAYHLAEVGKCPQRTVDWIEEHLNNGKIYGTYTISGEPVEETESTAVYALCVLIGQQTGSKKVTELARLCMERLQITEKDSEIYGAFGDGESLDVYSFDNLMALLALRTLAEGSAETAEEETEPADTVLIANDSERAVLEPLIQSVGKKADYIEEEKFSAHMTEKYRYVITTADDVLRHIPEGKKVFAVGTPKLPGSGEKLDYRETAYVSVSLDGFRQNGRKKEQLFYMGRTGEGQFFGQLDIAPGKKVPYSMVNGDYGYASYAESGDLSSIALAAAFREFFQEPQRPGKFYVMIDEIYPFTDKKMLSQMGADLHENGIPFLLHVMPVYENLAYPEFGRWADRILGLQLKGGAAVMHGAVDTGWTDAEEEGLESKMLFAESALEHRGVNLYPMEQMPVKIGMDFLENVEGETRNFAALPVDTVLVLPVYGTKEEWQKNLDILSDKWLTVSDYRAGFEKKETVYERQPEEKYEYREKTEVSMKGFFDRSNQVLLIIVGIAVTVFALILISSYRIYQRKFK